MTRHLERAGEILAAGHPFDPEWRPTKSDLRLADACMALGFSTYDVWSRCFEQARGDYFWPAPTPQTIFAFARTLTKHGRLPSKRERRAIRWHGIQWTRRQPPRDDPPF